VGRPYAKQLKLLQGRKEREVINEGKSLGSEREKLSRVTHRVWAVAHKKNFDGDFG